MPLPPRATVAAVAASATTAEMTPQESSKEQPRALLLDSGNGENGHGTAAQGASAAEEAEVDHQPLEADQDSSEKSGTRKAAANLVAATDLTCKLMDGQHDIQ